jgi:enoyl-CoA hydratase/carnithine racemase
MTARLPQLVGSGFARRMSMTGEVVDAARAERMGLVTEVVPHGRLRERALELAAAVAEIPGRTMAGLKEIYVRGAAASLDPALAAEREISGRDMPDGAELDRNRAAVTARNREQLATGQQDEDG